MGCLGGVIFEVLEWSSWCIVLCFDGLVGGNNSSPTGLNGDGEKHEGELPTFEAEES